jgi:hypothetical protein
MPWFHFHLYVGDETIVDLEGRDLPSRDVAVAQALVGLREILAEDIRGGRADLTLRLALSDESGVFHVTTCSDALAAGS